jgi:hypothetical protein
MTRPTLAPVTLRRRCEAVRTLIELTQQYSLEYAKAAIAANVKK